MIVHAKGGGSEHLSVSMRNPCDRQLISIHVRLQFFDSSLKGFFAKNRAPLFEQPLRQLRHVFGVLNQVANPNSTHINSMVGPNYGSTKACFVYFGFEWRAALDRKKA